MKAEHRALESKYLAADEQLTVAKFEYDRVRAPYLKPVPGNRRFYIS